MEPAEIPFRDLDELEGATLADRFVLQKEIGRGGYGAVFVGEQKSVRRRCAVKVLVPHVLEKEANIKRFEREAKMTSALAHPNTVIIYDFGYDEVRRLLYLVMEYIDGESLRDRIQRERQLDLETVVWIAHQAAGSLQDAHENGMVHRDIKPHNIMLTTRGGDRDFVKVIDFGIARFLDDDSIRETFRRVTQTGMVIGTPAYMSPEQVRSQELDGRADQYSLAACVYEMLTGAKLFSGDSAIDIATKQLTQRPRPVSERNRAIAPDVERVLMKALSKDREQRFDTITDFTRAFAEAAGVVLRATDSAERDREAELDQSPTVPFAPGEAAQPTTQPMAAEAETRPAELKPLTPTPPAIEDQDADAAHPQSGGLLLALGLGTACIVLLALVVGRGGDDADMPRREPVAETVAVSEPIEPEPAVSRASDVGAAVFLDAGGDDASTTMSEQPTVATIADAGPTHREPDEEKEKAVPAKAAVEPATGRVSIAVVPWGTVMIDGRKRGSERLRTYELSVGRHRIELVQDGQVVAKRMVDVKPGKNKMVKLIAAP